MDKSINVKAMNTKWIEIYVLSPTGKDLLDIIKYDDDGAVVDYSEGAIESILEGDEDYIAYTYREQVFIATLSHLAREKNEDEEITCRITIRL